MTSALTRLFAVLGILAMLGAAVSIGLADVVSHPDADEPCCAAEAAAPHGDETDDDCCDDPLDDDCCTSGCGCHECFLPCCSGQLSLEACSITFDTDRHIATTADIDDEQPSSAHPRAIYHPPRP